MFFFFIIYVINNKKKKKNECWVILNLNCTWKPVFSVSDLVIPTLKHPFPAVKPTTLRGSILKFNGSLSKCVELMGAVILGKWDFRWSDKWQKSIAALRDIIFWWRSNPLIFKCSFC